MTSGESGPAGGLPAPRRGGLAVLGRTGRPVTVARAQRRELALVLLLGVAGAGLVFLVLRPSWATVVTLAPRPLPASKAHVTGNGLIPYANALVVAALACLVAVLATRRLARRMVGGLLAVSGAAMVASVLRVSKSAAIAAATSTAGPATSPTSGAGSTTAGGSLTPGTAGQAVAGFPAHATLAAAGWQALAGLGGLTVIAAGLLVIWRAYRLAEMSSRYEAPGESARPAAPAPAAAADSASMWEALSRGDDPTTAARSRPERITKP